MTISMATSLASLTPDIEVSAKQLFGVTPDWKIPAFADKSDYVPALDENYQFDPATTRAILAGFAHNRRVMIQGLHGTGKSSHLEQIAARLNWPMIRINLDGHVSRIDLIGRDAIILENGQQITTFQEGILPWAFQNPVALVFDEYDAGRPDVMFVIQRVLESEGRLTLLDQNRVLTPHPFFRIFATANTIGLGDQTGMYHGTHPLNQGQLDRWHIVANLNYLPHDKEVDIIMAKFPKMAKEKKMVEAMVRLAALTREAFFHHDLSTVMSPRTVMSWAENYLIFGEISLAFRLSFYNRTDETERSILDEFYQRCFGQSLEENMGDA